MVVRSSWTSLFDAEVMIISEYLLSLESSVYVILLKKSSMLTAAYIGVNNPIFLAYELALAV